jgi:hypothetical protein
MDDPFGDLDKRVAGYEVEAILFTRAQLFRGPDRQRGIKIWIFLSEAQRHNRIERDWVTT